MTSKVIDIHPHVISTDTTKYPQKPLFGIQSEWSKERPVSIEKMIAAMDEAGVDKAAIVHSSTCYGFDCSYLADCLAQFPDRFTGIGSIDMLASDAVAAAQYWIGRGITGFRVFTGGTTKEMDVSDLDNPRSYPVWELLNEKGLSMSIQTDSTGIPAILSLAKRFPKVMIIIDHMARPDLTDGPPYTKAKSLFAMADEPNIYIKVSTVAFERSLVGKAAAETFFPKLVDTFGADRLAWGSNFPAAAGKLSSLLAMAQRGMSSLSEADRDWIFGKTAQKLYPALADR